MNEHLPKCVVCGQSITYDNKLTITIQSYEKASNFSEQVYTNSTKPKMLKRYDYHKTCYQKRHPEVYAKLGV